MTDREIIKELGGVSGVAKAVGISQPGVSYWCRKGIPKLRRIQLKVVFPEKSHLLDVQTVQPTTTITSD